LKGHGVELGVWATWIGIPLCVAQSGIFSGLNLALFGVSALRLEAQSASGNADATRLLELRRDSNFLLTTVLWGNVATNVLLTILSESALAGVLGFVFSTFVITFGGEILPQAYFSRNALRMATLLRPVLRFWQVLLFPLAKPTAILLDAWLGKESLDFLREDELREVLKRYVVAPTSEVGRVEGIGALNFLALDDLRVAEEGESIDPLSLIELPEEDGRPIFPHFKDGPARVEPFCHRPIVVEDPGTKIDKVLPLLRSTREQAGDDVIDADVILVWGAEKRVITGADILGRLLRGIARPDS
jgi:metal transporter CNNM